jgi:hypothetical protein
MNLRGSNTGVSGHVATQQMAAGDKTAKPLHMEAGSRASIPWFDLGILYAILIAAALADLVIVLWEGFQVVPGGLWNDTAFALLFIAVGVFYAATGRSSSVAALLFVVASLVLGGPVVLVLDFVTKAIGSPFADPALAAWDQRLGLDWIAYERWFSGHPTLSLSLGVIYSASTLVMLIALVALGFIGDLRRMVRLAIAGALTLIASIVIGGFLPAVGPHRFYGVDDGGKAFWVDTIMRVVTEQPHLIVLDGKQPPLTTFPSFHTTLAVLATIACCRIPRFGIVFGLFNLCWAFAIPVWGSHYFTDMLAGGVIAVLGYAIAHLPGKRSAMKAGAR